jgi:hypothetical protein
VTHEEREGPYRELGARIAALPWPLTTAVEGAV